MTEGTALDNNGGPGHVNRFVSGQPNDGYYEPPSHIKLRGMSDDEQSNGQSTNRSTTSFKDKIKNKLRLTQKQKPTEAEQIDRATDPLDRNSKSARSSNIPGTYGYQHTKTSILRYESTKAKIEEEREDLIRKGIEIDDLCLQHQGGHVSESRKGSVRERTTKPTDNQKGKFILPSGESRLSIERRNSLNNIETNLEKEAARRQIKKNSDGGPEFKQGDENKKVSYEGDAEKTEEIERRILQRRSEASQALSEDLLDPTQLALHQQILMKQLPNNQLQQTQLMQQQLILQQQQLQLQSQLQQIQQTQEAQYATVQPPSIEANRFTSQAMVHQPPQQYDGNQFVPQSTIPSVQPLVSHVEVAAIHSKEMPSESIPPSLVPGPIGVASNIAGNTVISNRGVTKEAIENAIAEAALESNNFDNEKIINKESTVKFNDTVVTIDNGHKETSNFSEPDNNNTAMPDRDVANNLNLPDDVKIMTSEKNSSVEQRIQQNVTNVNITNASSITEANVKNDSSVLNIPSSKKNRNKMLEKKSVFTIAYDGMKTDQLRPDSASADP